MTSWIGVASRDHVLRGRELGIVQAGHGKRSGIVRMRPGDWIAYYSPSVTYSGKERLQAFTTLGRVADDEVWQADEGDFRPWRRRADYVEAREAPIRPLLDQLSFTAGQPSWGMAFRRGLFAVPDDDLAVIRAAMAP